MQWLFSTKTIPEKKKKKPTEVTGGAGPKKQSRTTDPARLLLPPTAQGPHSHTVLGHTGRSYLLPDALQDGDSRAFVVSKDADGHSSARAADSHDSILAP